MSIINGNTIAKGSFCKIKKIDNQNVTKSLNDSFSGNEFYRELLYSEYKLTKKIYNGTKYEIKEISDDMESFKMSKLETDLGKYLEAVLNGVSKNEGAIRRVAITRAILEELSRIEELFDNQLIHNDLKPNNIMISEGKVYIIDWGISPMMDGFFKNERIYDYLVKSTTSQNFEIKSKYTDPDRDLLKPIFKNEIYSLKEIFKKISGPITSKDFYINKLVNWIESNDVGNYEELLNRFNLIIESNQVDNDDNESDDFVYSIEGITSSDYSSWLSLLMNLSQSEELSERFFKDFDKINNANSIERVISNLESEYHNLYKFELYDIPVKSIFLNLLTSIKLSDICKFKVLKMIHFSYKNKRRFNVRDYIINYLDAFDVESKTISESKLNIVKLLIGLLVSMEGFDFETLIQKLINNEAKIESSIVKIMDWLKCKNDFVCIENHKIQNYINKFSLY